MVYTFATVRSYSTYHRGLSVLRAVVLEKQQQKQQQQRNKNRNNYYWQGSVHYRTVQGTTSIGRMSSNKFPPPLKEALPSDSSPGNPAAVVYRNLSPWEMYPPGTAVVILGATQNPPPPPPPPPASLPAAEDDNYRLERRDLSYLSFILSSWQRGAIALAAARPARAFPTHAQVQELEASTTKNYIKYEHAGVKWRSSHFVKIDDTETNLIVHLANDGFLYFNPADLEVDKVSNDRHKNTCPTGWMVFKTGDAADRVKEQLADFKAFAVAWFGSNSIRQSVLYNPQSWRIDICFQSKETGVGLEFSFEPDWPVPVENYWWD